MATDASAQVPAVCLVEGTVWRGLCPGSGCALWPVGGGQCADAAVQVPALCPGGWTVC